MLEKLLSGSRCVAANAPHQPREVGKAGRLQRLDVRSRLRPLKMKDCCVVRGRGGKPSLAMLTVGACTLLRSLTNQAHASPSNEQGVRTMGVNYSYLLSWERCGRRVDPSLSPASLQPSAVGFFWRRAASVHTNKTKPGYCLGDGGLL